VAEDPAKAKVPTQTARRLRRLRSVEGVLLALVTGRDAAQLERMISLPGAWRVLEHGRCIVAPGEQARGVQVDAEARRRLARFRCWALERAAPLGAVIEDKDCSIVVNVRKLTGDDPEAAEAILAMAREAAEEEGLSCQDGRAILEAQLDVADKGDALGALLEETGAASLFYVGDDLTDLSAIALASMLGVGIFVRSPERPLANPEATATLEGIDAVASLLEALEARLKPGP
jgi:trehalose-phosphatase